MTPTDPVPFYLRPPSYPPTPFNHDNSGDVGHIPSCPPSISSTSDGGQPLTALLAAIEVDQVMAAAAFIEAEEGPQPGIQPDTYWRRNFEDPDYRFFRLIPDHTGTLHVTPFTCVDFTTPSPQLLC